METKFKIIGKTNGWIASRDVHFNGKTEITIESNLTKEEANDKILKFFNKDYETYFSNWGLVRMNYPIHSFTSSDRLRWYEYDSRYYEVVHEEEDFNY